MKKSLLLAIGFVLAPLWAVAQNVITGHITDVRTGDPLIGASVIVKSEKGQGVVTDIDGNFSLQTKVEAPLTLRVEYVGYRALDVDVYDFDEPVEIALIDNANKINEVVVVGYGTQKRIELTSSISTVSKDVINQPLSSVENALQGAVAGLNVSTTSGQPGAVSNIRIRGGNSITGGNEPLYVIDGLIVYNDASSTKTGASGSDASLDPLAFLNPSDIDNIEVLKDVSATAIYGTRGANGVIIITTKKGSHGRNTINYTGTFGWSTAAKKLDFLNAQQFTQLYNELNPDAPLSTPTANYNWQDAALRTAFTQDHQISFTGGDEISRYSISGGFKDQKGIIIGTDLKRYTGRINYERNLSQRLLVGINASGAYSNLSGLRNVDHGNSGQTAKWAANSWMSALITPSTQPIYNADGSYNYSQTPVSQDIFIRDGKSVVGNPISDLNNIQTSTTNTRVIANAYAEWEVVNHLKLKANIGTDLSNTKENNYSPSYTTTGLEHNGVASVGDNRTNVWQAEFTANYDNTFKNLHHVSLLAGYTTQRTDRSGFATTVRNFANDATGYNNLSAASDLYQSTSEAYISTLQSVLGRLNYSYDSRYNASLTLRADGSSRFAKNHKWGWFPSAGFSWNIDKEKFVHFGKSVDFLQLRLSAGIVGNQEIGDYQFGANVSPTATPFIYNGQETVAYYIVNKDNPDLKWEKTASYNAGISSGFFQGHLTVTFDAYYKKTTDLLLQVPVEGVTGYATSLRNIGAVTNKGVELEVGAVLLDRKDLKWNVNGSIAHNKNEVTSLGNATSIIPNISGATIGYISPLIVAVGEPLGTFYGYKFKGIVQSEEQAAQLTPQTINKLEPGNPYYEDVNGDGVVNTEDQTVLGNSQPKFTYGLNTTLKYKNWDFFVNFAGSYGNKLYNGLATRLTKGSTYYNSLAVVANRWTPTNPSNVVQKASNDLTVVSDSRYVEDASYLRVKNIQLSYTLAVPQISKDARLRLYVSLQNFFTFTNYSGYDPEGGRNGADEQSALYQGIDMATYPTAKTVLFGINVTL
ncbi:MAG: TonB-dependent receptor [Prevotella sp.]|nr:TonB-dependent receptor [Prevotella sp.]